MESITVVQWVAGLVVAAAFLLAAVRLFMILRRAWAVSTDPDHAYHAGRKTRRAIEDVARNAGRATGEVERAAGVLGRSFRKGRDAAKGSLS